jgi:hypothetical protein
MHEIGCGQTIYDAYNLIFGALQQKYCNAQKHRGSRPILLARHCPTAAETLVLCVVARHFRRAFAQFFRLGT